MPAIASAFSKFVCLALPIALALVNAADVTADQAATPLKALRLASVVALGPNVNPEDGRLALEVIMQKTLVRKTGPYRIDLTMLSGLEQLGTRMARERFHFLALTGLDYAEMRQTIPLTPLLILSKYDQPFETFLLVSDKNHDLHALANDANRVVVLDDSRVGDLSRLWLDTVLWRAGFPASDQFFTAIKRASKPSQVLLPVFFGQADACVIAASAFSLMAEFNPQIEERLAPLARSPDLVSLMLCATEYAAPEDRRLMLLESQSLKRDPMVQQALTIVQMKRVIPFRPAYFEATAAMIETYRRLQPKLSEGSP